MTLNKMANGMRFLCGSLPRICYHQERRKTFGGSLFAQCRYSAHNGSSGRTNEPIVVYEARDERSNTFPNMEIFVKTYDDKFGEQFRHFPLPGNATTSQHFLKIKSENNKMLRTPSHCLDKSDVSNTFTTHERQMMSLYIFSESSRKLPPSADADHSSDASLSEPAMQCVAFPCPNLMRKHFAELFPNRDIKAGILTLLTLSRRIEAEESKLEDEEEREKLVSRFTSTANSICDFLQREGYWAEFIDPTSGRAYPGPFIKADFLGINEHNQRSGWYVCEDLSSCKIIQQRVWTPRLLLGTIVCNVPLNSPVLEYLELRNHRTVDEDSST